MEGHPDDPSPTKVSFFVQGGKSPYELNCVKRSTHVTTSATSAMINITVYTLVDGF